MVFFGGGCIVQVEEKRGVDLIIAKKYNNYFPLNLKNLKEIKGSVHEIAPRGVKSKCPHVI